MLKSREGQKVPNVTFPIRVKGEWQKVDSDTLFKGKTVVLFALPGAFTPTCSNKHLPRFNELASVFKANDIDSPPPRVTLFSQPGCQHCARARKMLIEKGLRFEEIELGSHGISFSSLQAVSGQGTTPQVYVEGQHIGGADELALWLAK
jgi:glutaredoxin-like protein